MSLTNDTILNSLYSTISTLEKLSTKDLLATPNAHFVNEYNKMRKGFVTLNPAMEDAAPPDIQDQIRYVEILAYSQQLHGLVVDAMR